MKLQKRFWTINLKIHASFVVSAVRCEASCPLSTWGALILNQRSPSVLND
jgi:hypothetical protein